MLQITISGSWLGDLLQVFWCHKFGEKVEVITYDPQNLKQLLNYNGLAMSPIVPGLVCAHIVRLSHNKYAI